jgi:hypothetical protein
VDEDGNMAKSGFYCDLDIDKFKILPWLGY